MIALMAMTACASAADDAERSTRDPADTTSVESHRETQGPVSDALWEFGGGDDPAASPIDRFWSQEVGGPGTGYTPPTAVIGYAPGEVPATACGARLTAEDWVGNAYYCDLDNTISYDVDFVAGLVELNGEHAGLAVLAHEWGHHVQHMQGSGTYTIQRELEADCLAAHFFGRLELEGGTDAIDSTMNALYRLGDAAYAEATWFAAGKHGSPNQRFAAAALGMFAVQAGLSYCQGFGEWSPGSRVSLGPSSLAEIPGHRGDLKSSGTYVVSSGDLPAFSVERVRLDWEPTTPEAAATAWLATQTVTLARGPYLQSEGYAVVDVERTGQGGGPEHELVGVYGHVGDPDHALVVRAALPAGLTDDEAWDAYQMVSLLVSVVGTRICGPGEQAEDPGDPGFNYICDPEL